MSKLQVYLFPIFLVVSFALGGPGRGGAVSEVVKDIDLEQYAGTWYEIARLPNKHQKGLVEVTSTFRRARDGRYVLVNSGYKGSRGGKRTTVGGRVYIPDPHNTGAMKVKAFIFSVDYRIIDVDRKNYHYALVTSDSKDLLWILCKSPIMDPRSYELMVQSARTKGFNTDRLERVPQVSNSAIVGK